MAGAESKGPSNSTREDRLKQALRANLRRRKMQAKERAVDVAQTTDKSETGD